MNKDFRELQYAFARHLRDPDQHAVPAGIEERRMAIYRDLFFNNIKSLLAGTFPVLHRILGEQRWAELARGFYRDHVSRTPLFMEVPREFLQWLNEEFRDDGNLPAFTPELAHYEWLELDVSIDTREIDGPGIDADGNILDGVPVLSPVARVHAYAWPVHRISPVNQPTEAGAQPTFLVVYRRRDDEVGFTEVNALTARLLELLGENTALAGRALLGKLADEMRHPNPQAVIEGGREILENLKDNDIVSGTRR